MVKSKKIHFWVTKSLLDKIELEADKKGLSRNSYIELMLTQHFELDFIMRWCEKKIRESEIKSVTNK